jgi:hypothetical protein
MRRMTRRQLFARLGAVIAATVAAPLYATKKTAGLRWPAWRSPVTVGYSHIGVDLARKRDVAGEIRVYIGDERLDSQIIKVTRKATAIDEIHSYRNTAEAREVFERLWNSATARRTPFVFTLTP